MTQAYILTLSCPDRRGLVHAVSGFWPQQGCNNEEASQYNASASGLFFRRDQFACDSSDLGALKAATATMAETYGMQWSLDSEAERMKTVLMVSRQGHCL